MAGTLTPNTADIGGAGHAGRCATSRSARRLAACAVIVLVGLVHGVLMQRLADVVDRWRLDAAVPQRLQVVYTRELELQRPRAAAAPVLAPRGPASKARARRMASASAPQPASSVAPSSAASVATGAHDGTAFEIDLPEAPGPYDTASDDPLAAPVNPVVASSALPQAPAASTPQAPPPAGSPADVSVAAAASAPASTEPALPFEWPASTRLSYALTGRYRDEMAGSAQVEWVRVGTRYQVHLDVVIGPTFAPLLERRMSSDGELTAEGLAPRRYDEETRSVFGGTRRASIRFEPDGVVVLPAGRAPGRWPGVQDQASQFVQFIWLFASNPQLLRPAGSVSIALALPRRVDRWDYDVVGEETLATPVGEIRTLHLKPRRVARPGGDRTADIWFAPQLQYLPVRILIRQGDEAYVDLLIRSLPQQADR